MTLPIVGNASTEGSKGEGTESSLTGVDLVKNHLWRKSTSQKTSLQEIYRR